MTVITITVSYMAPDYEIRVLMRIWAFQIGTVIIESVDSIRHSRDERDAPLTQYITNTGISCARYIITHFKHYHRVLWLVSNRMSYNIAIIIAQYYLCTARSKK